MIYWTGSASIYCWLVYLLLRQSCPITWDDGGPTPSFYWGKSPPSPTMAEYYRNPNYFDGAYRRPYVAAAGLITLVVLGGTLAVVRIVRSLRKRILISSFLTSVAILFVVCALSDIGGAFRWWNGPRILYAERLTIVLNTKLFVAIAALSSAAIGGSERITRPAR